MNFLSLFVLIPLLMLLGLWLSRNLAQVRAVMVTGASALLVMAVGLTVAYLDARHGGATEEMLFRADVVWYPALNITTRWVSTASRWPCCCFRPSLSLRVLLLPGV